MNTGLQGYFEAQRAPAVTAPAVVPKTNLKPLYIGGAILALVLLMLMFAFRK